MALWHHYACANIHQGKLCLCSSWVNLMRWGDSGLQQHKKRKKFCWDLILQRFGYIQFRGNREALYIGYEETGISPQCLCSRCSALFCLTGSPVDISDSQLVTERVLRCLERHNWPKGHTALCCTVMCGLILVMYQSPYKRQVLWPAGKTSRTVVNQGKSQQTDIIPTL